MKKNLLILSLFTIALFIATAYIPQEDKAGLVPFEVYHFEDKTNAIKINQLIDNQPIKAFKKLKNDRINFGFTESNHWLYFKLETDIVPADLSLEIQNHRINHLELFERKKGKIQSLGITGDRYPFAQRPTPTHTFVYPIRLDSYENTEYFLLLDNRLEELSTHIMLRTTSSFEEIDQKEYLFAGFLLGFVGLVVLVSGIYGWVSGDKVYFWYIAYILTFMLRQMTDIGLGFQYLWPNFPKFNTPDPLIMSVWLYIFSFFSFLSFFVLPQIKKTRPFRVSQFIKWIPLALFFIVLALQIAGFTEKYNIYTLTVRTHAILAIITIGLWMWMIFENRKTTEPTTIYFNFAIIIQLFAQTILTLQNINRFREDGFFIIEPILLLMVVFFIDMITFLLGLVYRFRQSQTQNENLQISLIKTQQQQNQQIIEALQSERQQITADLYENIGTSLSAVKMQLSEVKNKEFPLLEETKSLLKKATEDLRSVTHNLIPVDFIEKGLSKSVAEMIEKTNQSSAIKFTYSTDYQTIRLNLSVEVQVYRIISELIKNILKHSHATEATVSIFYKENTLEITAKDNGTGFDETQEKDGIGIKNLHARAKELRGNVKIDSGNWGTKIVVTIPI